LAIPTKTQLYITISVEQELNNICTMLQTVSSGSIGTKQKWHRRRGLRKWDDDMARNIVQTLNN
jgi:hypothetical protein